MRLFNVLVMVVVVGLLFSFSANAQDQSKEHAERMKKWNEYKKPGANHKYLESFVGEWNAVTKMWMQPGAQAMESKSTAKMKMILGGRYLKMKVDGMMMGAPMEGVSITGYDNFKKKFESFWIDSTGTGMYLSAGTLDKSGKVRTETAVWDDITTGGKMNVTMITTSVDQNTIKFEMLMGPKDKMFKSMEIIYTRKK